jgi:hypothetical protein
VDRDETINPRRSEGKRGCVDDEIFATASEKHNLAFVSALEVARVDDDGEIVFLHEKHGNHGDETGRGAQINAGRLQSVF